MVGVPSDNWIIDLDKAGSFDVEDVGGKASSLARLRSLGYPVPDGFVVAAEAYWKFLADNRIGEVLESEQANLRSDDYLRASLAAKRVRDAVMTAAISEQLRASIASVVHGFSPGKSEALFAVRSSAGFEDSETASWAGQFDSFLDVAAEDVCDYVRRCWASFFASRAVSYGAGLEIDYEHAPFAVIVQRMAGGKASGVAFSVDPTSEAPDKMLIEAVRGSAEAVVGGRERPYAVVVDKAERIVLRRSFGSYFNAEPISAGVIRDIVELVSRIEDDYGHAVDVEWTYDGGQVSILQARAITGGRSKSSVSITREPNFPDILDYELTFKVTGLGFLFADLLARGFGYLHPLLTFLNGEFRQYFTNERMEYAAREGYRWLSQEGGFRRFQREFEDMHTKAQAAIADIIAADLTVRSIDDFFGYLSQYFSYYSHTDFQFTNLTFLYAEEDRIVGENLRQLGEFKERGRVWINCVSVDDDSALAEFLSKVARQFRIAPEDVEVYKIEELKELFGGNQVSQAAVAERQHSYVVYVEGGRIHYVAGQEAATYVERISKVEESRARSDVIGQIANRGSESTVSGSVRVINVDYGDLDRMDQEIADMIEGEILVSEFTAPELMGACRKARAIITDLGGMLSHAAIVSRELGIPCLVGTQHASKAFKNGDRVVIDLDSGFVQKGA